MTTSTPVAGRRTFDLPSLSAEIERRFGVVASSPQVARTAAEFVIPGATSLLPLCNFLVSEPRAAFAGLIVEERAAWELRYVFYLPRLGWTHFILSLPLAVRQAPSISARIHAADWYEREAEDLFGLVFEEHPRLGDFILHDQVWQEEIAPMRKRFDAWQAHFQRRPQTDWHPQLVVKNPGAFAMPVGPVYEGGIGEAAHFLLETVGEDVVRAVPRLFYNYRGVEKIAEGRPVSDVLLLAERFAAKSAFAHSLALCQAAENALAMEVPVRAGVLRVILAELERIRHHAGAIQAICQSTALGISEAHAAIVEEELLRTSCIFAGHRYLFGLNTPGGLTRDFDEAACREVLRAVDHAAAQLNLLEERLRFSSSFLDRLEDVGIISTERARELDLVGPIARASGLRRDLRLALPYSGYAGIPFAIPCQSEGDGYARLRQLFAEARQSAELINEAIVRMEPGPIRSVLPPYRETTASGWVEAPIGAALHWVRLDSRGRVERYRILSPSFRNWLALHIAVEDFAFQDFPIILASLGLSATECDR